MVAVRTLYLLRHAKSDWSDAMLADHDRPLAPRGMKAARRMGGFIAGLQPQPSVVLCSSAKRAQETWNEIAAALSKPVELHVEEGLYGASAIDLRARIRRLPRELAAVMVVGHNPGMQELTVDISGDGDPVAMNQLTEKFPTCALAAVNLDVEWPDVVSGSGYLKSLVIPRDLPDIP